MKKTSPSKAAAESDSSSGCGCLGCLGILCLMLFGPGAFLVWRELGRMKADAVLGEDHNSSSVMTAGCCLMILALVFFYLGLRSIRKEQWREGQERRFPDQPWRWHKQWVKGEVRGMQKRGLFWVWAVAGPAGLLTLWLASHMVKWRAQGDEYVWLVSVVPLVGAICLGWAIRETWRVKKFGRSVFRMLPPPGIIGGSLVGVIRTSVKLRPEAGFQLSLSCHKMIPRHRLFDPPFFCTLWREESPPVYDLQGEKTSYSEVPVHFYIPDHLVESDPVSDKNMIIWQLEVSAEEPGVDYADSFAVPVYYAKGQPAKVPNPRTNVTGQRRRRRIR